MKNKSRILIAFSIFICIAASLLCAYPRAKKDVLAKIRSNDYQSDPIRGITLSWIHLFRRHRIRAPLCGDSFEVRGIIAFKFKVKVYWRTEYHTWILSTRRAHVVRSYD